MNLYLDTSALVKLYAAEAHSDSVRAWVNGARVVITSRVAYAEARAVLARRHREKAFNTSELKRAVQALDRDLGAFALVEVSERVGRMAGVLAQERNLRGFDAIHLASALEFQILTGSQVMFAAYDARLCNAAAEEGLLLAQN